MNATLTAAHTFTASTEDRRRCTCGKSRNTKAHGYTPTRGAARAAADKLTAAEAKQQQAEDTAQAAEDAVAAIYARFTPTTAEVTAEEEAPADVEQCGIFGHEMTDGACEVCGMPDPAAMPAEETTPTPAEAARILTSPDLRKGAAEAKASEDRARERAATRQATDAAWAAALTAPRPVKAPAKAKRKPETEKMTSLWVARNMVEGLIARATDSDPAVASIAAKVDASTPNNRGGRTIRLNKAELLALSGIATEVENAATEAGEGTVAMSAQKLHARLGGYLATY
jgi:hypothetical protein